MADFNFQVTGMSCGHCENAIKEEVSAIPGVTALTVSAQLGELSVTGDESVTPEAIITAVEEAGYTATQS